jgi:hypothetical protein
MYIDLHIKVYVPKLIEWPIVAIVLWYRRKRYGFAFRRIKLDKGKPVGAKQCEDRYAIIDPDDYPKLCRYDWLLKEGKNTCYAWRMTFEKGEKLNIIYMHREIMQAAPGTIVDHKNCDGLNNTKRNLRFASRSQNRSNSKQKNSSSKYKGIRHYKKSNKWAAQITHNGKTLYLGYFDNEIDAAKAYDAAAKIYHGEFAKLNFG